MSHTVQELNAIRVIAHSGRAWPPDTDSKKRPPHLTGDRLGACIRAADASGHIHQYQGDLDTHYVICSAPLTEHGSCPGLAPVRIETGYSTKPARDAHDNRTQRQGRKEEE